MLRVISIILLLIVLGLSFASYLTIYGLILLVAVICYTGGSGVYVYGGLRASRSIHRQLIESVLGTTLRYISKCLDTGLN